MEKKTEKTLRQIKNLVDQDPLNPTVRFLRPKDSLEYYSVGRTKFMQMAHEAGAILKIGGTVLIDRERFEEYLESFRIPAGRYK